MSSKFFILSLSLVSIAGIGIVQKEIGHKPMDRTALTSDTPLTPSACALRSTMRRLWEDHVAWTRNMVLDMMDEVPGTAQVVQRLLKNQDDIGDAIKPFYGEVAGVKLADLLRAHLATAGDVIKAAKADDQAAFAEAHAKWLANADEIATFLSNANPQWSPENLKAMLQEHVKVTTEEVVARKNKDYDRDIMAYDRLHDGILAMSDILADGIVRQFPDRFQESRSLEGGY